MVSKAPTSPADADKSYPIWADIFASFSPINWVIPSVTAVLIAPPSSKAPAIAAFACVVALLSIVWDKEPL